MSWNPYHACLITINDSLLGDIMKLYQNEKWSPGVCFSIRTPFSEHRAKRLCFVMPYHDLSFNNMDCNNVALLRETWMRGTPAYLEDPVCAIEEQVPYFYVINLISRSYEMKTQWFESNLSKNNRPVTATNFPKFAFISMGSATWWWFGLSLSGGPPVVSNVTWISNIKLST